MKAASETIYALSTPPGRGAVAVVRVSGPHAHDSLSNLIPDQTLPAPRHAAVRLVVTPDTKKPIDAALILLFRGPASFTGEDIVEYHLHGGWSVVQALLQALAAQDYHRMAQPGEFTRRAFENRKLDLTEAEAIADLIDAETEAQRLLALDQLSGSLETLYQGWTDRLAKLLALMEADLDFSDQDLPDDLLVRVRPDLSDLIEEIRGHLDDNRRGERLRDGIRVVVLGAPNAGKSSLVNVLAQRDVAIVSKMAGTTRDIIDVHLDIGGYPVILTDTAGLRPELLSSEALAPPGRGLGEGSSDHAAIESEGIRRALDRARSADLKLLVFDGSNDPDPHTLNLIDDSSLVVLNKSDLNLSQMEGISVSASSGKGISDLLDVIQTRLEAIFGKSSTSTGTPTLTRARHREALMRAAEALDRSMIVPEPELAAEDLRLAVRHLGSITGHVDVEDLLDMIFRDFCIGK
jgi:tRNA modification GTPase